MMNQGTMGQPHGLRRLHHHHHGHHLLEDNDGLQHPDPSPSSPSMPESASSLRRHVALLMPHHRPMERSYHAIQPVSPASYGSSLEVTPYNPAITPSSTGINGRIGGLKTSTELLKVLNRIWSLEEQHSSNILLVKGLKKELDRARAQIKDLLHDQVADRQEIDELMRQIAVDKLGKKSKEQERMNSAIQSLKDQLEDERKLRKRSESLHRKLARELNEVKMKFATNLHELEMEKKRHELLEDLCDEFAQGIRDYEQELRSLSRIGNKDSAERSNQNRLIIHMSESWLDVRVQMRQESHRNSGHSMTAVDKLRDEIQTFLQAKNTGIKRGNDNLALKFSESAPLNVGVSAAQGDQDEEDSIGSDSNCFELQKPSKVDMMLHSENSMIKNNCNETAKKKQVMSDEKRKSRSPTSLQVNFEEHLARALSRSEGKSQYDNVEQQGKASNPNPEEISNVAKTYEICDSKEEGISVRRNRPNGTAGLNVNTIDSLIRSRYRLSESVNMTADDDDHQGLALGGNSVFKNRASPVRKWAEKLPSNDLEVYESSSSKLPPDLKENTLKSKLIEARTRGQRSRSRFKGIKDPI